MKKSILAVVMALLLCLNSFLAPVSALASNSAQIANAGGENTTNYETDGVKISKTIAPVTSGGVTLENYFDVTLGVELEESKLLEKISYTTEIAVVLDVSNTMNDASADSKSRFQHVIAALKNFVNSIASQNPDHVYLTLITFATDAQRVINREPINAGNLSSINRTIDNIQTKTGYADRYTNFEAGLQLAYNNLKSNPADHQYVLLMTDGFPTTYSVTPNATSSTSISGYNPRMDNKVQENQNGGSRTIVKYDANGTQTASKSLSAQSSEKSFNRNYYGYRGYFGDPTESPARLTLYGTSYSDWAAYYAQKLALEMKGYYTSGSKIGQLDPNNTNRINIFSIGIDIGSQSVTTYEQNDDNGKANVVDLMTLDDVKKYGYPAANSPNGYPHIIGSGKSGTNNDDSYENWMGHVLGGGQDFDRVAYYDLNTQGASGLTFQKVWEDIEKIQMKRIIDSMALSDPMGDQVEFLYFYNKDGTKRSADNGLSLSGSYTTGGEDTASYNSTSKSFSWNLGQSGYTTTSKTVDNKTTTVYKFEIKYRVRLTNESSSFIESTDGSYIAYGTNNDATLTYTVEETDKTPETKRLEFPDPAVTGRLGSLSFTKYGRHGDHEWQLEGAHFTLKHMEDCSVCAAGNGSLVNIADQTQTSGADGKVSFTNIPSGHEYILKESPLPGYGSHTETTWKFKVDYGDVLIMNAKGQYEQFDETQWSVYNDAQIEHTHIDLALTKTLKGMDFTADAFTFNLQQIEVQNNDHLVQYDFDGDGKPEVQKNIDLANQLGQVVPHNSTDHPSSILRFPRIHIDNHLTASDNQDATEEYAFRIWESAGTDGIVYDDRVYEVRLQVGLGQAVHNKDEHGKGYTETDHTTHLPLVIKGMKVLCYETGKPATYLLGSTDTWGTPASFDQLRNCLTFTNTQKTTPFFFDKLDSENGKGIAGVAFTLTHNCGASCKYTFDPLTTSSDANGRVYFEKVYSGHTYLLTEETPAGYAPLEPITVDFDADGNAPKLSGETIVNDPNFYTTGFRFWASKLLDDAEVTEKGLYSFRLTQVSGDPLYMHNAKDPFKSITMKNGEGTSTEPHIVVFPDIVVTKPGTYVFTLEELPGDNQKIVYDWRSFRITAEVTRGDLYDQWNAFSLDRRYTVELIDEDKTTTLLTGASTLADVAKVLTFMNTTVPDLPVTGDTSRLALWLGLLAVASGGAFLLLRRSTRKEN